MAARQLQEAALAARNAPHCTVLVVETNGVIVFATSEPFWPHEEVSWSELLTVTPNPAAEAVRRVNERVAALTGAGGSSKANPRPS